MNAAPDPQTLQANERTLLAWIRTGLTVMAFGFVIARLSVWLRAEPQRDDEATGAWFGIAVVGLAIACHVVGGLRFVRARRAILAGRSIDVGIAGPIAIAVLGGLIGLAAVVYLVVTAR